MTGKWNLKLLPPSLSPWAPAKPRSRQIAVLMSGGVDSSMAAHLLKETGWDVLGITMKIPTACEDGSRGCCGAEAAFVCNELNVAHYFIDVTEPFEKLIIERFRQSYANAETPNPCVDCNTLLKFSLVWDFLQETFGIDYLATGHYARVCTVNGTARLGRARDKSKDQSYFLYGIAAERLERFVLPLGDLTKEQVRSIASALGLSVADKAESMELCFSGEGDYRRALDADGAGQPGDITDMEGNVIGRHKGIENYTLGQRRGIGYAGGRPLYVGRIDRRTNTIALGTREQVCSRLVSAKQLNVLVPEEFTPGNRLFGKIRSYGEPQPCQIARAGVDDVTVEFDSPQFAVCPGQRLVLYNSRDSIVAGGTIISPSNV
ncbi:MAG: tRNA 2-thiouridine(34) synthase MnmA [Planctomycetota bacterium]